MSSEHRPHAHQTIENKPVGPTLAGLGVAARLSAAPTPRGLLTATQPLAPADGWGVQLETDRMRLRPLRADDSREFLRVLRISREHLEEFCPIQRHGETGEECFLRQLELAGAAVRSRRAWRVVGFLKGYDHPWRRVVAGFNINNISRGLEHRGEITAWVAADAVNQGLASEGLEAVVRFATEDLRRAGGGLGLHKLIGLVSPDNDASKKIATRAGFSPREVERPIVLHLNGKTVPHEMWVRYASVASSPALHNPAELNAAEDKPASVIELKPTGSEPGSKALELVEEIRSGKGGVRRIVAIERAMEFRKTGT